MNENKNENNTSDPRDAEETDFGNLQNFSLAARVFPASLHAIGHAQPRRPKAIPSQNDSMNCIAESLVLPHNVFTRIPILSAVHITVE